MIYTDINTIPSQYELIMTDPPWKQSRGGKKAARPNSSGKDLDYPTQSLEEIEEYLRIVTERATDNVILFLWATEKYLVEAQRIAEKLGYKLHVRMVWSKCGMGQAPAFTVRFTHEYLLWMYRGKFTPIASEFRGKYPSVFDAKSQRHSQKPEIAYEMIENIYPNLKKLEMYARRSRNGWDSFGNEVDETDVL